MSYYAHNTHWSQAMPVQPAGAAIRRMRVRVEELLEDGTECVRTVSAAGFIARLAHVPGQKASDTRREFTRFCRGAGIIATPCEWSGGTFSKRTGKAVAGTEPQPTAYQVMGEGAALALLFDHATVAECHAALAVRVPVIASGSGEECPRALMGSAFGKPQQVKATATALAKQNADTIRAKHKAWGQSN